MSQQCPASLSAAPKMVRLKTVTVTTKFYLKLFYLILPGGYAPPKKVNDSANSGSDSPASQSEEVPPLFRKTKMVPHPPPQQDRRNSTPTALKKEILHSKEYEVPYPGEKPKSGEKSARSSGSVIQDSRKRIAQAIGRKWNTDLTSGLPSVKATVPCKPNVSPRMLV